MEDKTHKKTLARFQPFFYVMLIIWTCILLWAGFRQNSLGKKIEEQLVSAMLKNGIDGAGMVKYLQEDTMEVAFSKQVLSQTGSLSYLVKSKDAIPEQPESNMVKIVSYFSGKTASQTFWSAAGSQKALENELFLRSDQKIAQLAKEDKKGSQISMAELSDGQDADYNKKSGKSDSGDGKTDISRKSGESDSGDGGADVSENSEEEVEAEGVGKMAVPAQSILLFRNGSPDITFQNKAAAKKADTGEEILCDSKEALAVNLNMIEKLEKTYSRSYLLSKFYITDSSTSIDNSIFQAKDLIQMDLTLKKKKKPQILIFHTHGASEAFIDSRSGKKEDSIIGVGTVLAEILSKKYGYQVLHDKTEYDRINGKIDRNKAYNNAYSGLQETLAKYPSIQVIIDLHRDGVGNHVKRTTVVNGKRTAQAMFFNGLSRNASGDIAYLHNDNLPGNLAFSLQLKIACMKRFKDFARPVYLKGYRYNMHLRKRFTLIELGNENNTVQEQKNAAAPLAMAIDAVLQGK